MFDVANFQVSTSQVQSFQYNYKYNNCDQWILDKIQEQKNQSRFYFLCKGDLSWIQDGQRENQNERDILFELYKNELNQLQFPYYIIEGQNRFENAKFKLKEFGYKSQIHIYLQKLT